MIRTLTIACLLAATTACGTSDPPPTTIAPIDGEAELDDLAIQALESTWSAQPLSERRTMCAGWSMDSDAMTEAFLVGDVSDMISVEVVTEFFDRNC